MLQHEKPAAMFGCLFRSAVAYSDVTVLGLYGPYNKSVRTRHRTAVSPGNHDRPAWARAVFVGLGNGWWDLTDCHSFTGRAANAVAKYRRLPSRIGLTVDGGPVARTGYRSRDKQPSVGYRWEVELRRRGWGCPFFPPALNALRLRAGMIRPPSS